jgi:O-antigen/teichoic acid export membrane protein
MAASQAVGLFVSGGLTVYAIRNLSLGSWGHYATALALLSIFAVVSEVGISSLALREIVSAPEHMREVVGTGVTSIFVTSVFSAVLLFVAAGLLGYPREVMTILAISLPILMLLPLLSLWQAAFNARRVLAPVAQFRTVQILVFGAAGFAAVSAGRGPEGLAAAWVLGTGVAVFVGLTSLRKNLGVSPRFTDAWKRVVPFMRAAAPIAGIGMITIVYDRLDVLMLSTLSDAIDVAHYTVPYTVVKLTWVLPSIIAAAFFPLLSTALRDNPEDARRSFLLLVRLFLFLSVPIALALAVASDDFLPLAFGDRYRESTDVLQILAWTSVLGFQNYIFWYAILAARLEKRVLMIQIAALVLNAGLNAVLIPTYGPVGAAISFLASDAVVVVGQVSLVHRRLFPLPLAEIGTKPLLATSVAVPASILLALESPAAGAASGVVLYCMALLLTGYISGEEWRPLTAPVKAAGSRLLGRRDTDPS